MRHRICLLTVLVLVVLSVCSVWGQRKGMGSSFHGGRGFFGHGAWVSGGWKGVGIFHPVHRNHHGWWRSSFYGRKPYPVGYLWRGLHRQFYGYRWGRRNYSSSYFVERWKDRTPQMRENGLPVDGPLLSNGMGQEEVMRRLGSPIQRTRIENGERWKYSSYTLFFSSGVLTGVR